MKTCSSWAPRNSTLAIPSTCGMQLGADAVDVVAQLAIGEAVGGEAVDDAEDVAEVVVEERPEHALRQGVADVADAVAHLLPDLGHALGREGAVEIDVDRHDAGPGDRPQRVEAGRLLQPALQPVGQLVLRLLDRRAGPDRGDQHGLDGEGRVLVAAEVDEGEGRRRSPRPA